MFLNSGKIASIFFIRSNLEFWFVWQDNIKCASLSITPHDLDNLSWTGVCGLAWRPRSMAKVLNRDMAPVQKMSLSFDRFWVNFRICKVVAPVGDKTVHHHHFEIISKTVYILFYIHLLQGVVRLCLSLGTSNGRTLKALDCYRVRPLQERSQSLWQSSVSGLLCIFVQ